MFITNMEDIFGTQFEYMEVILCPEDCKNITSNGCSRCYNISDDEFSRYLSNMRMQMQYKYFTVDTKEYYHRNLQLVKKLKGNAVEETKVYQMTPINILDFKNFRIVIYDKKKLSTVAFPSSQRYDFIKYKRKLIFRVNNKIYVNFQQEKDGEILSKKIYINFNNNKDTNIKDVCNLIKKLIKDITAVAVDEVPTS